MIFSCACCDYTARINKTVIGVEFRNTQLQFMISRDLPAVHETYNGFSKEMDKMDDKEFH